MSVGWSDTIANSLINLIVNGTAFTAPTDCYAALYTSAGGEPGLGTPGTPVEASYTGYQRYSLRTRMAAASGTGRQSANTAVIDFGTPSVNGEITLVLMNYIAFWRVSTLGDLTASNYIGHGTLTQAVTPAFGSSFTIAIGNLVLRQT
jgi:hypothetical protein